jgi:hypothetical protein
MGHGRASTLVRQPTACKAIAPCSASRAGCDSAPPRGSLFVRYDLWAIAGTRLTFTDAAAARGGAAVGVIEEEGDCLTARWAEIRDADGGPLALEVEGIALDDAGTGRVFVVVDVDAHDRPSELCEVRVEGLR